jgi:hypothetical protein
VVIVVGLVVEVEILTVGEAALTVINILREQAA